ncbi:MAG: DJ-1/PfpI family protein [Bdellovibrionales bacterium]
MPSRLAGRKIAILIANGFDEDQVTEIQRALVKEKANIKSIAPEQGVVNGWHGNGWGHHFPIDAQINETLGSDFDMLILSGGERAVAKLKGNLHTRRIVSHFLDASKPIAALGAGVGLLALSTRIAGREIAAPAELHAELKAAGAVIVETPTMLDRDIYTSNGDMHENWVDEIMAFFDSVETVAEAA